MYFDGDSSKKTFRVGIPLVSPKRVHTSISIKLNFEVSNNVAEYKACIIGLEVVIEIGVRI